MRKKMIVWLCRIIVATLVLHVFDEGGLECLKKDIEKSSKNVVEWVSDENRLHVEKKLAFERKLAIAFLVRCEKSFT